MIPRYDDIIAALRALWQGKLRDILGHALWVGLASLYAYKCAVFMAPAPGPESILWAKSIFSGWLSVSFFIEGAQLEAWLSKNGYTWANFFAYPAWGDTWFDIFFANGLLGSSLGALLIYLLG